MCMPTLNGHTNSHNGHTLTNGANGANGNTMTPFEPTDHPHRRFNPLTGKHILVSPHRTKRPWNVSTAHSESAGQAERLPRLEMGQGQTEEPVKVTLPSYDEKCYLCPRNKRMGGHVNPAYKETYLFNNDFPALLPDTLPVLPADAPAPIASASEAGTDVSSLFASEPVRGRCSVLCFHPRHDVTLARMAVPEIVAVVQKWRETYAAEAAFLRESGADDGYVQIFENRGAMMGASAPHPHGQVWTLSYVPDEVATELANLEAYANANATPSSSSAPTRGDGAPCLLCTYAHEEVARAERVIAQNEHWVAVVPFWAVWPYEVMVLPYKRHIPSLVEMTPDEDESLAGVLKEVLVRYDNLFSCPFPYSMGLHQSPLPPAQPDSCAAHAHFHFYPPLLRSASVRKFLVGFEMLGESQRDLTAEQAATRLRALSAEHYLDGASA